MTQMNKNNTSFTQWLEEYQAQRRTMGLFGPFSYEIAEIHYKFEETPSGAALFDKLNAQRPLDEMI